MEKLNMLRKKVSADAATEFKFESPCCVFLVKNMSKGDIFLSFGGAPKSTDDMLMLPAGSWQRHVCHTVSGDLASCTSVFVKGSGEAADGSVEVECLKW